MKKRSIIILFLSVILHPLFPQEHLSRVITTDSLYLAPLPENPRTSEGAFIRLKNNDILMVNTKFTGGSGDHDAASLIGRISKNEGKTWSKEILVAANEGSMNIMSVSLLRLQNGNIALFYLVKNQTNDCYPVMRISKDESVSWSSPVSCIPPGTGYYVLNNNRVLQLENGRIIVPVSCHSKGSLSFREDGVISCIYSDDNGVSWSESQPMKGPEGVIKQEPGVIPLKDGRLLMYVRTKSHFQYFSYSKDNGQTWTEAVQGTLQSARSPALILRNPFTKDLVAVWNDHPTERTPLCIAVSKDDGQTWTNKKSIENNPGLWYCYPALEFLAPDMALVSYCFGDKKKWGLEGMMIRKIKF
ncbi:MAG: glycoside hydrolase [Bacteroidales bacterium]|jgi:Neuraminidase (sialidase)|nr:glycoside hydrolase [Bacteroidales bacterium]